MVSVEPGQSRGSTETMLSRRSFGNEQVHCSQVRFFRNVPRHSLRYAAGGKPAVFLSFRLGIKKPSVNVKQTVYGLEVNLKIFKLNRPGFVLFAMFFSILTQQLFFLTRKTGWNFNL